MIDCHCHLDESADLKSAQKCGVKFFITSATNLDDFQKTFNALVGKVMKLARGKADPKLLNQRLKEKL